ncbi:MAG: hypothetical protein U5Q44_15655 [Dehalococcoidia bacterium]|nr:hypothetical protein [Dehalococcoidia bacterium]
MADSLVELLADDFKPAEYKDEYREAVLELIRAKLEGEEFVAAPEPEEAKPSVDLMAALKASVEAAQSKKGGGKSSSSSASIFAGPAFRRRRRPARTAKAATTAARNRRPRPRAGASRPPRASEAQPCRPATWPNTGTSGTSRAHRSRVNPGRAAGRDR